MSIPAAVLRQVVGVYDASYPPDIYGPPPTPVLTALNPNSIVVDTPTLVHVVGSSFTSASKVYVDDVAQPTTYVSANELTYTALADSVGSQTVEVQTKGVASTAFALTVTASTGLEGTAMSDTPPADPPAEPAPEPAPDPAPETPPA